MANPRESPSGRRERRTLMTWGAIAALILGLAVVAWPLLPGSETGRPESRNQAAGQRFDQAQGESRAGTTTTPPPQAGTTAANPETVGRAERINRTAGERVRLTSEQLDAIRKHVAEQTGSHRETVTFSISVGSAVPQQAPLRDMPSAIIETIPDYQGKQYLVAGNRFVVVEKQTRRIVAIIPLET